MLSALNSKRYQSNTACEACIWTFYHDGETSIQSLSRAHRTSIVSNSIQLQMMEAHQCMHCEHEYCMRLFHDVKCFFMMKHLSSQRILSKISYAVWSNCCLCKSQWITSNCICTNANNSEGIKVQAAPTLA